jgi:hypothetical protein
MGWVTLGFAFMAYCRLDIMELISSLSGVRGQVGLDRFRELVGPLMINTCALIEVSFFPRCDELGTGMKVCSDASMFTICLSTYFLNDVFEQPNQLLSMSILCLYDVNLVPCCNATQRDLLPRPASMSYPSLTNPFSPQINIHFPTRLQRIKQETAQHPK